MVGRDVSLIGNMVHDSKLNLKDYVKDNKHFFKNLMILYRITCFSIISFKVDLLISE